MASDSFSDTELTTMTRPHDKLPPKGMETSLESWQEPEPPPQANEQDSEAHYPKGAQLRLILLSLCLSVFLVALDQTIIAPALGAITTDYDSIEDIGWYGASYLMTTTALQPLYGNIYFLFDVKLTFLSI